VRYFLDTEFTDLPWTARSELLWVALVDETGRREFSAVNSDCSVDDVSPFVREHVLPRLDNAHQRLTRVDLAVAVAEFIGPAPQFWAWCPSVADIRAFAAPERAARLHRQFADWDYQLLRGLFDVPPVGWPPDCQDLHALAEGIELPHNPNPHDPLSDAHWGRAVWLRAHRSAGRVH
jgi:hypothetical protein